MQYRKIAEMAGVSEQDVSHYRAGRLNYLAGWKEKILNGLFSLDKQDLVVCWLNLKEGNTITPRQSDRWFDLSSLSQSVNGKLIPKGYKIKNLHKKGVYGKYKMEE